MLARLYGDSVELKGPLFLKLHNTGAVSQKEPVVSTFVVCVLLLINLKIWTVSKCGQLCTYI